MPKLQYKTRSSDGTHLSRSDSISLVSPVSPSFSLATVSTAPTSSRSSDNGSSPSLKRATLETVGLPDARPSSVPPSHLSPTRPERSSKTRGGSFFSFFSVKEPSQQAFDDYQRQMRKKGARKNGQASAIGLPGVSSAKLPVTVPKVNSRWDGIPQAVKEKEKQKQTTSLQSIDGRSRSLRTSGSESSASTNTSSESSRGSSLNSKTRGLQHTRAANNTDLYGWETASESSGSITRSYNSHDEKLPPLPTSSPRPHLTVSQAPPLPSMLPEKYPKRALKDAGLLLGPSSSSSPTRSNIVTPPITSMPSFPSKASYVQSDYHAKNGVRATTVEVPDADEIIIASNGLHILGPPASARRKARDLPFLAGEADEMTLPDEDASPDTASKRQLMSHRSRSFPFESSHDVNPDSWVAKGANKGTENTGGSAWARSEVDMNTIGQAITPWEDPSPKVHDGSKERYRSLLTPDGGQKSRKKSMLGVFSK